MKSLLKQLYHVEDEPQGPSIDSEDMAERIECRRLRITQRVENQKRLERGELDSDINKKLELSKSRKQMELSRARLNKLNEDGLEFLSNVRVASDARENARRAEDEELTRVRREKLENEAKGALDRFEEISRRWESGLQKEIPQELHEVLVEQTAACEVMVREKNNLISELQLECKAKDDVYVKELKKQSDDIEIMVQRMNEQIECMGRSYREELTEVERAFLGQRDALLQQGNREWADLLAVVQTKQSDYLEARAARAEDHERQLATLRAGHAEEYAALKIKLEKEVQTLEQNIQTLKATYQLNLEKLDYNFQVVKKRDEENTVTKSQQKRRITRLQDSLNNLRLKLAKLEKQCRSENEQLTDDYRRRMEQFRDLQRKSRTLLKADAKHFREIWLMNETDLQQYAHKVLEADKIICEQQLGIHWDPPSIDFLKNKGPLHEVLPSGMQGRAASELIRELLQQEQTQVPQEGATEEGPPSLRGLAPGTVRALLELVCEEGSFLIEEKLRRLLEPLGEDEAALMKMDAVFTALGIESEQDVDKLLPYFLAAAAEDEPGRNGGHSLIHPTAVVRALHAFVTAFYEDAAEVERAAAARQADHFQLDAVDTRDDSGDRDYWDQYSTALVTEDRERLWDGLLPALQQYLAVLVLRRRLLTDTEALRAQNGELRFLLQQYTASPVNRELQVPPSRVIKYD